MTIADPCRTEPGSKPVSWAAARGPSPCGGNGSRWPARPSRENLPRCARRTVATDGWTQPKPIMVQRAAMQRIPQSACRRSEVARRALHEAQISPNLRPDFPGNQVQRIGTIGRTHNDPVGAGSFRDLDET